jgi:hypothetical protein
MYFKTVALYGVYLTMNGHMARKERRRNKCTQGISGKT